MCLGLITLKLLLLWVAAAVATARTATAQALLGCPNRCGNITIPYPFGTKSGCYITENFLLTCNRTGPHPKLYLGSIEVATVSLSGQLRIMSWIGADCYNQSGSHMANLSNEPWTTLVKFSVSSTMNKFTALGCDTLAWVGGSLGQKYTTGCLSLCNSTEEVTNGSCSGIGCCQTAIPSRVRSFNISVNSFSNHRGVWDFNPCSYAFVAEEGAYNFSSVDLSGFPKEKFPVVLDWSIGDQNCDDAKRNPTSYACKDNSNCYEFDNGPGYRCNCSYGYSGNPYIGCQDIDECSTLRPCSMTCLNLPGTYNCSCPEGYTGDGRNDGSGCIPIKKKKIPMVNIALGISISMLVLVLGGSSLYWGMRQREIIKLKERFFQQNGGILLQQQVSKHCGSVQSAKVFSSDDLKKATNNFHESRVLGQGGQGTVYKGILPDNTIVAIKKSKVVDQSQIEQFINEVIVLSQVNHRHVVKLLGCCLETEVPLLIYEFVTNGTLYDHIHTTSQSAVPMKWESRLRIASETASALSYLHYAASIPIIHRDVKTTNILLDGNYTAKVSDFGASRLIPIDQTQLTTLVQGTLGYLDPEYFLSSQLTEKSDVYSFGVVLVELLTSKKALSFARPEEERNLANYFVSSMKEGRSFEIVDKHVMSEAKFDQIMEVAILATRCLEVKGDDRPTMKEVAMELEGLRMMEKHPWVNDDANLEETEFLLGELPDTYESGANGSNPITYDTMRNHVISPLNNGR